MSNVPTRSLSRSVGSSHPFSFAQIRPQLTDEIHLKDPENCRSIFEGRPLARAFSRCSLRAGVVGLSATSRRSNPTGVMIPKYNTAITIRVVTNEVAPPRSSMRVQPAREGVGHQERSKTARSDFEVGLEDAFEFQQRLVRRNPEDVSVFLPRSRPSMSANCSWRGRVESS